MKKILIIEDNEVIRENMAEILQMDGYKVIEASNGIDGKRLARSIYPDIILCDIRMHPVDGYEVLNDLKKNKTTSMIPIAFVSAYAEKREINAAYKMGASGYLIKPFDSDQLIKEVRRCLADRILFNYKLTLNHIKINNRIVFT